MDATFVVGEHSFLQLGYGPDDSRTALAFIDLLDAAREQGRVLAWEELFSTPVEGFGSLSDFLFGVDATLDRDIRILLGSQLQRLEMWGEDYGSPPYALTNGSIALDLAPSVGLCLLHVADDPWAVLCVVGGPLIGVCEVREIDQTAASPVWFIEEATSLRHFWRDCFLRYQAAPAELRDGAPYAFPTSIFAPDVWSRVGHFEGAWNEVREQLVRVLAGLDDGVVTAFSEVTQNHERIALMSGRHGVDCSPESPQTHRNAAAMRQRQAQFTDRVRTCEWHAKLEPHRNRVHFCVEDWTVYIGVFARHLL